MKLTIKETEYTMATSLRVAYKIQSAQGHKPYMDIFRSIGSLPIESQLKILYCSFSIANPNTFNETQFIETLLDNFNLDQVMNLLGELIEGIMYNGYTEEETEAKKKKAEEESARQRS